MRRIHALAAAMLLVFGATFTPTTSGGDKKPQPSTLTNPYFPLAVGTTWEYVSEGGKKVVVKVAAHETLNGELCARLETDVAGGKVTEHLTVRADGVHRVRANNQEIKPSVLVLKQPSNQQPPQKDDTWEVNSTVQNYVIKGKFTVSEEKLKLGAADTDTFKVKSTDMQLGGQIVTMETWFAKDKGMVKQHFKMAAASLDVVLQLEKFTAGQ